jgi:RHS repeat-associated protein
VVAGGYDAEYFYLNNSPLVERIEFNDAANLRMETTRLYDYLNPLQSIRSKPSGGPEVGYGYQYNQANQRERVTLVDGSFWIYQYDELGQVKSGRRYWADGSPVAGQQFEYGHDDIGNRTHTERGGDTSGAGLRYADYTANNLNQHTSRDVPGAVDVMGEANAQATVTINGNTADRQGTYFYWEETVSNETAPQYESIDISATLGGQTQDKDPNPQYAFVPEDPESFTYDDDGNLESDGRWDYTWDGDNRLIEMQRQESSPIGAKQWIFFEYHHQGRRIRKTFYTYYGGWVFEKDIIYRYDGWRLMAELDKENNNARIRTYINPDTGRWLKRDQINEQGGLNTYGFCRNQATTCTDALGKDFIAVASRPVGGNVLYNHYSIQYWLTCDPAPTNREWGIDNWQARYVGAKVESVELLADPNWQAWRTDGNNSELVPVGGSVINWEEDNGVSFRAVYAGSNNAVKAMWRKIEFLAAHYQYAEDGNEDGEFVGGVFRNWPNSKYGLPFGIDPPANNSNTFV